MTPPAVGDHLRQALGEALVHLAGDRADLLLVRGDDAGPAAWFAQIWPDRVLVVPPPTLRIGIGQGIALGGGESVVVLGAATTSLDPPPEAATVLLGSRPAHLVAAHRAGVTVCQPGWPGDVAPLLAGALDAHEPVLLHLASPQPWVGDVPAPAPPVFGEPRVLHRGRHGLVVGAGPTAAVAVLVAQRLAARQVDALVLDSHTLTATAGVDGAVLGEHLLVGPTSAPRAGALQQVRVRPDDLSATVRDVRTVLDAVGR